MVRTAYAWLRSRGGPAELPEAVPPPDAGEREQLEAAASEALRELGGRSGKQVEDAMGEIEACLDALARSIRSTRRTSRPAGERKRERAQDRAGRPPTTTRSSAFLSWCTARREHADHRLLRELLALYDADYGRLKADRSGARLRGPRAGRRDLLRDEGLRARYRERFSHVLVDEFQDTNPLQNELLGLLERDNLFRVGDERQSIYGFRHADIGVFRGHAEGARGGGPP